MSDDAEKSKKQKYYRKVIKITAWDSPNVKLGLLQRECGLDDTGLQPDGTPLTPGVLPYEDFLYRLENWDEVKKKVSLYAEFYDGAEVLLYPPNWLDRAELRHDILVQSAVPRMARAIGIDPAEGDNSTSMCVVDDLGILELVSEKTCDTRRIRTMAMDLMRNWRVPADRVMIDRGGGGKQVADFMIDNGLRIRTVGFNESWMADPKRGQTPLKEQDDHRRIRYAYVNRRAEMYGELRVRLDPNLNPVPFGIPSARYGNVYKELRRQLALMPLLYDGEGRLYMLPKRKKDRAKGHGESSGAGGKGANKKSLEEIIGCSPDECDALVLAYHALTAVKPKRKVGSF